MSMGLNIMVIIMVIILYTRYWIRFTDSPIESSHRVSRGPDWCRFLKWNLLVCKNQLKSSPSFFSCCIRSPCQHVNNSLSHPFFNLYSLTVLSCFSLLVHVACCSFLSEDKDRGSTVCCVLSFLVEVRKNSEINKFKHHQCFHYGHLCFPAWTTAWLH